jgi:hypothetical protein
MEMAKAPGAAAHTRKAARLADRRGGAAEEALWAGRTRPRQWREQRPGAVGGEAAAEWGSGCLFLAHKL